MDAEKGNGGDERVVEDEYEQQADRTIMTEFQRKRHAEMKSMASVSHNWNTLFVNADAVATYLSARFGVSKVGDSKLQILAIACIFGRLLRTRLSCQVEKVSTHIFAF